MKFIIASVALLTLGSLANAAETHLRHLRSDRLTEFVLEGQAEGITEGPGSTLFVGEIFTGRVMKINVISGQVDEVVPAQDNRNALGLWYYKGFLFVCGTGPNFGGTPEVYVYDVATGESKGSPCAPDYNFGNFGSFLNDVVVVKGKAYVTDSLNPRVMVIDADKAIAGECDVESLELPQAFDPAVDTFSLRSNGVVGYGNGILVSLPFQGEVWFVDPDDSLGAYRVIPGDPALECSVPDEDCDFADGNFAYADGMAVQGGKVFATEPLSIAGLPDQISVWKFSKSGGTVSATKIDVLTSPEYRSPTTSALFGGYIYSANSRFFTGNGVDTVIGVKIN